MLINAAAGGSSDERRDRAPGVAATGDCTDVVVQREWNGWRTATVRFDDLEQIHWFQPPGAPRPLIHAYVPCTSVQSGDLRHQCESRSGPHSLLVCALKRHIPPRIFEELARLADRHAAEQHDAGAARF